MGPGFYGFAEMLLEEVEYVAGDLRGQDGKIVGKDDKDDPENEAEPVFIEIRVERAEVFHWSKDRQKGEGRRQRRDCLRVNENPNWKFGDLHFVAVESLLEIFKKFL
jgi:hypothetical protein